MKHLTVVDKDKRERIEKELSDAGIVLPRFHAFTGSYLPRILHDDERIKAAVFGRRKESEGFSGFVEGMLIATDERVLFLDQRPGYIASDEIAYGHIVDAHLSSTVLYTSVTLLTKIANYKISFAMHRAAEQFTKYIQERIRDSDSDEPILPLHGSYDALLSDDAITFLKAHEVGVLSTIERTGALSGAPVYYVIYDGHLHCITKEDSKKADNILGNQHVAFTVFDEAHLQTVQIQGIVEQVHSETDKIAILSSIMHSRTYADGSHKPPILRIGPAGIQTYRIIPTKFNFADYSKR